MMVALYELGRGNDDMVAVSVCSMNSAQRFELWQAKTAIQIPEEGVNANCSYEELALPYEEPVLSSSNIRRLGLIQRRK